jgi:hypothetical protein
MIVAIKIVDVDIISLIESEAVASNGREFIILPIFLLKMPCHSLIKIEITNTIIVATE